MPSKAKPKLAPPKPRAGSKAIAELKKHCESTLPQAELNESADDEHENAERPSKRKKLSKSKAKAKAKTTGKEMTKSETIKGANDKSDHNEINEDGDKKKPQKKKGIVTGRCFL